MVDPGAIVDESVSTSLVIINGFLVFFMQVGFLALETGSGRAKNVRNILLKNLLDVMLAALVWWAVGFAFAYGKSAGGVIGTSQFFYEGENLNDKATRPWFFSWTFCIAACTIISGCLAERTALAAYPVATVVIAAIVHPLLVHWIWNPQGFISNIHECNVLDFAGGMVVHMLGGLFGLVGAWMCGPRLGRFEMLAQDYVEDSSSEHSGTCSAGRGTDGDLVDSASELAGSSSPPGSAGAAAAAAAAANQAQQQDEQHLQQLEGLYGSRSLHTLLPPAPAAGCSSSMAGGMLELGHVGAGQDGFKWASSGGGGGSSSNARAGGHAAPQAEPLDGRASLQAASSGDGMQPDRSQEQHTATAGGSAAGARGVQHTSSGDGICDSRLFSRFKWPRQPQRQRRRAPLHHHDHHGTSAATCGRGICKFVPKAMPGHDMAFVTLGTFMLWFGWFGFNNGSVYMYVNGNPTANPGSLAGVISAEVVQRTSMNTALGGAAAGLSALLCAALLWGTYDLRICCNGVLSGLVIVTCMCGFVDPWAAVVCSAIAGALYAGASWALLRCGIDDPLDSSAVHLGSGVLGSIMVAFVANPKHVYALTGAPCGGLFYGRSGWLQLGLQLLGIAVVVGFAGGVAWAMFWLLKRKGLLRVDQTTELAGIDNMEHGGPAYPEFTAGSWSGGSGAAAPTSLAAGRRIMV